MPPMTNKPHPIFPPSPLPLGRPKPNAAQPRATLDGLEVQESNFGQWLAAGGDRRARARDENDKPR